MDDPRDVAAVLLTTAYVVIRKHDDNKRLSDALFSLLQRIGGATVLRTATATMMALGSAPKVEKRRRFLEQFSEDLIDQATDFLAELVVQLSLEVRRQTAVVESLYALLQEISRWEAWATPIEFEEFWSTVHDV